MGKALDFNCQGVFALSVTKEQALERPFSSIGGEVGVDLGGNQEIGGNNPPYLNRETGLKGDFNMKNNDLVHISQ